MRVVVTNNQGAGDCVDIPASGVTSITWERLQWTPPTFSGGSPTDDHKIASLSAIGTAGLVLQSNPTDILPGRLAGWEAFLTLPPEGGARILLCELNKTTNSIFGCDDPSPVGTALWDQWMRTCGDGSIVFEWSFGGEVSLTDKMETQIGTTGEAENGEGPGPGDDDEAPGGCLPSFFWPFARFGT